MSPFVEPRGRSIGNTFLCDEELQLLPTLTRRHSFSHVSYAHLEMLAGLEAKTIATAAPASVNDILPVKGRNLLAAALQDDSSRRSEFRNPPQTSEECGTCSSGGSTCGASEVQSSFPEASPISSESGNSTGEVTLPVSMNEVSPSEAAAAGATRRKKHQSPTSTAVASKGGAVTLSGQDLVRDLKKTGVSALARASALARDMRPKQRR
mmetsp:Transcript_30165/g.65181  ORF Transcript_30165/g.65181 Transcript_30165/m.65181 type:complete len:209 (+) Transcript_30165:186-812(+)|eukprot:CAMPEP_0206424804 /NCGR_PEP_ID=MMETSP0324_2-20121206/3437_1 /ASSEMBLY_ACC=CAM_ASM_000836 /TAXON_ID=2866 /ORGANISM="Crypthecodinium cohnii, Strain Seligo" /LENGTH=208 /DNA_ID=CAMNT_0053889511 /DNA_START=173 /DNA_END=799 /DNA_ORIENTATION=-